MRVMNKVIWPFQVLVPDCEDWNQVLEWCDTKLTSRYYVNRNVICLKTEEDCIMFSLRWL